jgi:hypothetical protein
MFRKNLEILLGNDKNKEKPSNTKKFRTKSKKFQHNKLYLLIKKQFLERTKEKI